MNLFFSPLFLFASQKVLSLRLKKYCIRQNKGICNHILGLKARQSIATCMPNIITAVKNIIDTVFSSVYQFINH